MRPVVHRMASPLLLAAVILGLDAAGASAQQQPSAPAGPNTPAAIAPTPAPVPSSSPGAAMSAPAGGWSGYRPGTARAASPTARLQAGSTRAANSQQGWATYAPSSAWRNYQPGMVRPREAQPQARGANVYASRRGWATYAPSSAWTAYSASVGQQRAGASGTTPRLNMRHAHVRGSSPYADGLARHYYEYGTGRPVPLAKPWLPGAP